MQQRDWMRWSGRLACLMLAGSAWAVTGTVIDDRAQPVVGAAVCYIHGDAEQLCAETDGEGFFKLPDSRVDRLRVRMAGFIPQQLPAVTPQRPIELKPAATLMLRLVGAGGTALPKGEAWLIDPTGKRIGPFPVNRAGLVIGTLAPGKYRINATAEGYRMDKATAVELIAREKRQVDLVLQRDPR